MSLHFPPTLLQHAQASAQMEDQAGVSCILSTKTSSLTTAHRCVQLCFAIRTCNIGLRFRPAPQDSSTPLHKTAVSYHEEPLMCTKKHRALVEGGDVVETAILRVSHLPSNLGDAERLSLWVVGPFLTPGCCVSKRSAQGRSGQSPLIVVTFWPRP